MMVVCGDSIGVLQPVILGAPDLGLCIDHATQAWEVMAVLDVMIKSLAYQIGWHLGVALRAQEEGRAEDRDLHLAMAARQRVILREHVRAFRRWAERTAPPVLSRRAREVEGGA